MKTEMWLIWKQPKTRRRYKIGSLIFQNGHYVFKYVNPELNDALLTGFNYFPGFEDVYKVYESDVLFANIATRLPNSGRADYLEILNSYNLEVNSSELEILKATRGRLITDNYEFVPAFDSNSVEFDIAGTSYIQDVQKCKNILHINDKLLLELEPDNAYDPNAIKVVYDKNDEKYLLGYVPRFYSKELATLLNANTEYSAMIQSLNFESEINDEAITANVKLIFNN